MTTKKPRPGEGPGDDPADPRSERERREGVVWQHLMRLHIERNTIRDRLDAEIATLEQAMTAYREGRGPLPEVPEFVGPPDPSDDPAFPDGEPIRRFPPRLLDRMSDQAVFDSALMARFQAEHGGKTPGDLIGEDCDRLTAHEVHARLNARTSPIQPWELEAARQRALDAFDDRKRRDGLIELILLLERCDWPQGEAWRARLIQLLEAIGPLRGHLMSAKRGE